MGLTMRGMNSTGRLPWAAMLACAGALLLAALGAGGCRAGDASDDALSGRLVITGSSTIAPLAGEIANAFEAKHPGTRVDVQSGGSSQGMSDVRRGTANIGMVSRALTADESDLTPHTIAMDGVTIIVNKSNPVDVLDRETVVGIFTGRIQRWDDAGGPPEAITVVNKADGRSTLDLFLAHFDLPPGDIAADVVIGDNQQGILTIAGDPNAIGYVSIGTALSEAERGVAIKALSLDGVQPTLAAVRDGAFPLSRPLNLVTAESSNGLARAFLDFAASPEVHALVEGQYFVPLDE